MFREVRFSFRLVDDLYRDCLWDGRTDIRKTEDVVLIDSFPVIRIRECQRQDLKIDQVLAVNAGKALRDDSLESQVPRRNGGMLAAFPGRSFCQRLLGIPTTSPASHGGKTSHPFRRKRTC